MKFSTIAASLAVVAKAAATPVVASGVEIPGGSPVEYCSETASEGAIQIEKLEISPNPPRPGEDLTIKAEGTVHKTVAQGAYVQVTVKLGLIKLLSQTYDLCEQVSEVDLKCPIQNGKLEILKTVTLPKEIPPAVFNVVADAYNADDENLTCLQARVDFMKHLLSEEL